MKAKVLIILGSVLILGILVYTYYIFFVPKVGPIGDGIIAPTTYAIIISSTISGISTIIRGILILKSQKSFNSKGGKSCGSHK